MTEACPRCHKYHLQAESEEQIDEQFQVQLRFRLACGECEHVKGSWQDTPKKAMNAWNEEMSSEVIE